MRLRTIFTVVFIVGSIAFQCDVSHAQRPPRASPSPSPTPPDCSNKTNTAFWELGNCWCRCSDHVWDPQQRAWDVVDTWKIAKEGYCDSISNSAGEPCFAASPAAGVPMCDFYDRAKACALAKSRLKTPKCNSGCKQTGLSAIKEEKAVDSILNWFLPDACGVSQTAFCSQP